MSTEDPNAAERFDVAKTVMLVGFSAATAAAFIILCAWAVTVLKGWPVDQSLREMALMSLTFLTTLSGFAKQFVDKV